MEQTALGILQVANAHMARALQVISVERGHDPRDFALVVFGGAGGMHACRVARTLVGEIKLAHEKEVLEGRVNGDLYQRLRAPIDEGRKVYASRIDGEPGTDYFHEEVVKILADNIVSRLGAEYPGPR